MFYRAYIEFFYIFTMSQCANYGIYRLVREANHRKIKG